MRILEINKFNFASRGADKHFLDVVDLLRTKGHEVAVFSMRHPMNVKSEWDKYFVSAVGYAGGYSLWQKLKGIGRMFYSFEARRKINKLLDDFQPDVVHIHNIYHQLSPAILFEVKKRKIPVVMTVHDFKLINPNYNLYLNGHIYDRCRGGKYYQCFLDKAVRNSYFASFVAMLEAYWHNSILKTYEKNVDLYMAPSVFVRRVLIERGIKENKIKVLPHFSLKDSELQNSTDTPLLPINRISELSKLSKQYALYFGRISKEKGVDGLVEIFEKISGLKLYLAGAIEDGYELKSAVNSKYLGFLDQEELKPYIMNSQFIISGSRLPETFGLAALEAISCGKPFLGFKTGAFSEIIENRGNGFLASDDNELKETIEKLASDKIIFNGEAIKKEADIRYNQEKYYQGIMNVFEHSRA